MATIRTKPRSQSAFASQDNQDFSFDAEGIKFDMYVKSREIQQITEMLQNINGLDDDRRQAFLDEGLLEDLMHTFVDDTMLAMDGLQLTAEDQESSQLSVQLVSSVREAVVMIRGLYQRDEVDEESEI